MSLKNVRQLKIREILLESCLIYKEKAVTLLLYALFSFLPNFLVNWFFLPDLIQPILGDFYLMVFSQTLVLLISIVNLIPSLAVAHIVQETKDGRKVGFTGSFRFALSIWGTAILTYLLMTLILLGLAFLLVIPAIIWSIYYIFFVNVIANRGVKCRAALDYSKDLVKGRWWKILGTFLALSFAVIFPAFVIGFLLGRFIPNPQFGAIFDLIIFLSINFLQVVYTVWFLNLDAIKHPDWETDIDPQYSSYDSVSESVFF